MPLIDIIDQVGWVQPGDAGVFFAMADGDKPVSVLVSMEAIDDVAPHSSLPIIAAFNSFRGRFAHIASQKYDAGLIEPGGSILVRTRDLDMRQLNP